MYISSFIFTTSAIRGEDDSAPTSPPFDYAHLLQKYKINSVTLCKLYVLTINMLNAQFRSNSYKESVTMGTFTFKNRLSSFTSENRINIPNQKLMFKVPDPSTIKYTLTYGLVNGNTLKGVLVGSCETRVFIFTYN